MIFELINPSDQIILESDDFEVAVVANAYVSRGKGGLKQLDAETGDGLEMPIFLFADPDEWFQKTFGCSFEKSVDRVMETRCAKVADCLESFFLGYPNDWEEFKQYNGHLSKDDRLRLLRERNEKRRTSMSDWAGYAHEMADNLRKAEKEKKA